MEDPDSPASLRVAMESPVTASLGPVGPLLRQLRELTTTPEGVSKDEIQKLTEDLEGLCISLLDHSEAKEPLSSTAKCWMSEVRELCYDTNDYLVDAPFISSQDDDDDDDDVQLTTEEKKKIAVLKFKALKDRANHASKRHQMYAIDRQKMNKTTKLPSTRRRLPVLDPELMIDDGRMDKLADMLRKDEEKQLKVVSLVGLEGVGKTMLAKRIYHQVFLAHKTGGQFDCGAFVRVSPNPDMRRLLTSLFIQIQSDPAFSSSEGASQPPCCLDAQALITNIQKHLRDKRYFIIIDDLWSTSVWDVIWRAFPDGGCHNRIITTTQFRNVASACCSYQSKYIFEMQPLKYDQSRKLFFSMVFGSEDKVRIPEGIGEVSSEIIEKCGGLPLSILNMASLLLIEESEINSKQWMDVRNSLPCTLRRNPTSEGIKEILNLAYNNLSPELKTCLLHLVVYPEGYTVNKDDLVKQWVIEGLIGEGQNKEEIAGRYFDELVSRGMIQAVDINYRRVLSCTLHHTVHDFVVNKSMEENFIISVDYYQSAIGLLEKVRRLSVQFGGARSARKPAGIMMSEVRSLAFFGFYRCADFMKECKLLRVLILHVWADQDKVPFDLFGISKLLPLRYVKIACNISVKLPAEIHVLQCLETLEVDTPVVAIPSDIGGLSRLSSLKVAVRELSGEEICILQKLPALTALSVDVKTPPTEWIVFGKGGFLVLSFFTFRCSAPRLLIEESSMPKIEKLNLCLNAHKGPPQDGQKPITIEHLVSLKEISVKIWGAVANKRSVLTNAVSNDARNPIPIVQLMEEVDTSGVEVHMTFNLNGGDYSKFIRLLIDVLVKHDDAEQVQGHPVLGKQLFPKEPKRWMHIKLVDGMAETILAVRDDNLNLIGFQAKNGRWYELGFAGRSTRMLPGSTFLECDLDYTDLLQLDHDDPQERNRLVREEMVKLELGRKSAIAAVSLLSRYKQEEGVSRQKGNKEQEEGVFIDTPTRRAAVSPLSDYNKTEPPHVLVAADRDTRRALVRLKLMFCEATRMIPSFNTVLASWDDPAGSCRIRKEDALYIWYWGKMSAALLEWEATGYKSWGPNETTAMLAKEINVKSAQEALAVVKVLLNTRGLPLSPANNTRGRPLVEVFRARADSGVVDTISVFDGRRGQTIYSRTPIHDSPSSSQGMLDLALTGPYRAISAEGSFLIQVDGGIISRTNASDEPSKVSADMSWDCYSDEAVYNKVLVHDITTDKGQLAEVTYAVLSDAVEATVQVKLPRVDPAVVYGKITAHNKHYGGNSVLLFSRSKAEAKKNRAEEARRARSRAPRELRDLSVLLARSVVAVPLGSPLEIRVNVTAYQSDSRNTTVSFKEDVDFSLIDQHVGEIERHGVVVQVTSLDICTLPEQSDTTLPALPTTQVPWMASARIEAGMPTEQPEHVYMDFNCRSGDYAAFMDDLCEKLADHPGKAFVHGRPVLARQRSGKPARLFMIKLAGFGMNETVTLAIRDDNLYLVGFKNANGRWYEFGNSPWARYFQESTFLGSNSSYESLLGKAEDRWQKLKLGRKSAINAVGTLSVYEDRMDELPVGEYIDQDSKLALASLKVVICEAARLAEIYDMVKKGWEDGICITDRQVQYIDNWENISRFLFGRRSRVRNIGLDKEADAAAVVKMVFNPFRPLVEVFGVRAYPSFRGTISAVDGKGSKVIIYNNDHQAQRDDAPSSQALAQSTSKETEKEDLPPTATYRPVSADGEIHIQVHGNPTTHARLTLVWDGHSDEAFKYKNILIETYYVASAELTYAVLRDAVEATMKVQLNLKDPEEAGTVTGVYGEITATNQYYKNNSIMLFSHPKEEAVKPEVNASDAAVSIPLKLMRDFIAASLECVLVIKVSLCAVCSSYKEPICFDQDVSFDPNMGSEQTMKIDAPTMEAQVTFTASE